VESRAVGASARPTVVVSGALPRARRELQPISDSEEDQMETAATAPTYEEIAQRAYEISQSEHCASDEENWWQAEAELAGQSHSAVPARPRRIGSKAAAGSENEKAPATKAVAKLRDAASKRRSAS
jgi:hypothetical protein